MSPSSAPRPLRLLAAALLALASFLALGSVASAQTDCYGGPVSPGGQPEVCGSSTVPPSTVPSSTVPETSVPDEPTTEPTVLGVSQTRFALTGGDVVGLVAIGGGALAVGAALVLATRRRRALEVA